MKFVDILHKPQQSLKYFKISFLQFLFLKNISMLIILSLEINTFSPGLCSVSFSWFMRWKMSAKWAELCNHFSSSKHLAKPVLFFSWKNSCNSSFSSNNIFRTLLLLSYQIFCIQGIYVFLSAFSYSGLHIPRWTDLWLIKLTICFIASSKVFLI